MKKVLIITYYWPPSGGAGVQRWLKFSKYLPQYGWEPIILTVDPEYAAYPAIDHSLEKEIPEGIKIYRTKATDWYRIYGNDKSKVPSAGFAKNTDNTFRRKLSRFIRGNFFIPDPRRGWNRYAYRQACELIEKEGIRHIITTSPPHSTQLIGLKLKRKYPELRWISDLRDPWTDIYYYDLFYPAFPARIIDRRFERSVLERADRIITIGPSLKDSFISKVKGIENKIEIITNGFDESDFKGKEIISPSLLTITYTGTLSESYPVDGITEALSEIQKEKRNFLLRFVGVIPEPAKKKLLAEIKAGSVEFIPYCDHSEAISYILNSTVLLLIIPGHKHNKNIITGKLFEYIASNKPILCLGPEDGDAAAIISQSKSGKCFSYHDKDNIKAYLLSAAAGTERTISDADMFSHKNLAKKLVSCFE